MLLLGSQYLVYNEIDAVESQIADVFSDSKQVKKFRMYHNTYDAECKVILTRWIFEYALLKWPMRSYTVSECSIQNTNCTILVFGVIHRLPLQCNNDFSDGNGYKRIGRC